MTIGVCSPRENHSWMHMWLDRKTNSPAGLQGGAAAGTSRAVAALQ